jgi:hypothetical protein
LDLPRQGTEAVEHYGSIDLRWNFSSDRCAVIRDWRAIQKDGGQPRKATNLVIICIALASWYRVSQGFCGSKGISA